MAPTTVEALQVPGEEVWNRDQANNSTFPLPIRKLRCQLISQNFATAVLVKCQQSNFGLVLWISIRHCLRLPCSWLDSCSLQLPRHTLNTCSTCVGISQPGSETEPQLHWSALYSWRWTKQFLTCCHDDDVVWSTEVTLQLMLSS